MANRTVNLHDLTKRELRARLIVLGAKVDALAKRLPIERMSAHVMPLWINDDDGFRFKSTDLSKRDYTRMSANYYKLWQEMGRIDLFLRDGEMEEDPEEYHQAMMRSGGRATKSCKPVSFTRSNGTRANFKACGSKGRRAKAKALTTAQKIAGRTGPNSILMYDRGSLKGLTPLRYTRDEGSRTGSKGTRKIEFKVNGHTFTRTVTEKASSVGFRMLVSLGGKQYSLHENWIMTRDWIKKQGWTNDHE